MNTLQIENKKSRLEIDLNKAAVIHMQGNGRDLCEGNTYPLFVVSIIEENYENKKISATEFVFQNMENDGGRYVLNYSYHGKYIVSAEISGDWETDEFRFRCRVKNNTNALVEWVEYPGLSWKDDLDGSRNSQMLWLFNEGALVSYNKDKMWPYEDPGYPSWGSFGIYPNMVESQFMAYLYKDGGLYIGCHDKDDNVKQLDFYHKDDRIKLQLRFYSGVDYGEDFSMDFDAVFCFFKGEWQDACEIYRRWFEKVTNIKKIENNEKLPVWYEESPLVVALPIRGAHDTESGMPPNKLYPYNNLLKEVEKIEKKAKGKLLILLMQWEGTAPWAPPYVWPPYGGEEGFKEFSKKLHEKGHYLGLYCSGFAWTQQSKTVPEYNKEKEFKEKNLKAEMCVGPDQRLEYRTVCTPQTLGYDFCPNSKFLREVIMQEVNNMFNAGVDYIQLLDQNHGGGSYFCYSKDHGHPPVPGKWQVDSVNEILKNVYQDKKVFGCESAAAQAFIDNLRFSDNRYPLAELVGDAVPAYSYIYHSRVNNFMGNQCCCSMLYHEDDYCYRLAYSFLAGDMLTVVINEDGEVIHHWGAARENEKNPNQKSLYELISKCNSWRVNAKQYLCFGDMQKPLPYACEEYCLFEVFRRQNFEKKVPKVLSNAFSYGNKRADIFVNYTKEEVTISISQKAGEKIYATAEDYKNGLSIVRSSEKLKIAPLTVVLIENEK